MDRYFSFKKKLIAISVMQALSANSSMAATITVDNGGDAGVGCTLREAVLSISSNGANPNTEGCVASGTFGVNNTINFSVSEITGITAPHIQITQDVSINPGGAPVSITSLGQDRVFNVILSTVSMNNLTISGGSVGDSNTNPNSPEGGAGISVATASLTLTNSTVSGNSALDDGGGIFIAGRSFVRLVDSAISGNTAGDNGGGIFLTDNIASLSIENSTITGNSAQGLGTNRLATGNGGGLHMTRGATASISNSVISGNSVNGEGGAIFSVISSLSLTGSSVSNNISSYRGGGISARNGIDGFSIDQGSVVSGNESGGQGGGIYTTGDLSVTDSHVSNNTSRSSSFSRSGGGGGIFLSGGLSGRKLTMRGSTVSGNSASVTGGGIIVQASVEIEDSTIANNVSDGSIGGIGVTSRGTNTFNDVRVLNNNAVGRAGGVYIISRAGDTSLSIDDSTISGNSSGEKGGGIHVRYSSALQLNRTLVSGNSATGGGGIHANGGPGSSLVLHSSAITENISSGHGGGIDIYVDGSLSLNNSTVSGNSAGANGGGVNTTLRTDVSIINSTLSSNGALSRGGNLFVGRGTLSLSNSLIIGGNAPLAADVSVEGAGQGTNTLSGVNLLGDDRSTTAEALDFTPPASVILATSDGTQATALSDILLPLTDNGGATQTHALSVNSPAIDSGDNNICAAEPINNLDQRGEPRPIGGSCDIGAYESAGVGGSSFFVVPLPNGKSVIFGL